MCLMGINDVFERILVLVDNVVIFSLSLMNRRPRAGHLKSKFGLRTSVHILFSKNKYLTVSLVSLTSVFIVRISV